MDKTLVKGLEILEALAQSESSRGVSELARELGLTKSNVHRTLQTLCGTGYVRKNEVSGAYECTMKIPKIAAAILGRVDMKRVAEPFMQVLAGATQETVHLSVLDDTDVFYVHKIDSPQPVRAYSEISGRAPAYCVATGKALLAFQDDSYLQRFGERLRAHTPRTIATQVELRKPLAAIGISGPVERLRPPQLKSFTPEVLRAAREISEALGYTAQ
jgi:DNA-binding IclR family transcriptional regulator